MLKEDFCDTWLLSSKYYRLQIVWTNHRFSIILMLYYIVFLG